LSGALINKDNGAELIVIGYIFSLVKIALDLPG